MKNVVLKSLSFIKLSHFPEMQNDALMHREGLKGFKDKNYMDYMIIYYLKLKSL